jgi:hypothetical protein
LGRGTTKNMGFNVNMLLYESMPIELL